MSRTNGKKRRSKNRVQGRKLAAMSCAVLLCAAVFTMTIAARVYLTELSEETAKLNTLLNELKTDYRNALAEHAGEYSPYALAEAVGDEMAAPGEAERFFLHPPQEDQTVYHPAYQTRMDKPKMIWEYFG